MRPELRREALLLGGLILAVLAWAVVFSMTHPVPRGTRERPRAEEVAAPDTTHEQARTVRLFFASPGGDSLVAEAREQASRPGLHERVEGLVRELARGPRAGGVPLLPAGTAVRHVYLDHRGLMTLDLTPAFRDRFRGGSTAEYLTVGSIVRTLFENVPEARRLRLVCGGETMTTLGGHIACDLPFDRSNLR